MNTAISDTVSEMTVKPISRAPRNAASNGSSPSSMWRTMFSIITMASSTTKPVPMVSAISDRLSSENPQNHITPKVAISDSGSATPAMMVARMVRRNTSTTRMTSPTLSTRVNCTSRIEARIVVGAVVHDGERDARRHRALQLRQLGLDALHGLDDVGAGLALDVDHDRRMALVPAADLAVLQAVDHVGDVAQQHRRAVAVGHDDVAIGGRRRDLVVGRDRVGLMRAVERALGARHIGGDDDVAHVFERDAVVGEPRQIGLDAHRRPDVALHGDAADAGQFAQSRRQQRVGDVAQLPQRDVAGGQRQRDDRRIGRVHLRIDRRIRQVARQRRARRVDRGLHVLGGGVDVAVEIELQRDLADAERTRRRHQRERGNLAEIALERRRHQRRHGVGAGARQLGRDLDGGEIDLRQRRRPAGEIAEQPAQQESRPRAATSRSGR